MKQRLATTALALALGGAFASAGLPARADDIDIFTGASAGTAGNPRILIVLDNTSNWSRQSQKWPGGSSQGQSEVNAIRTVVKDLDNTVNLGLMEFVTGGSATDDGGFIRYGIREMNTDNKAAFTSRLTTIYNNITSPDEKRNSNTPYGNLMYDVYNYLAGGDSHSPTAVLASLADATAYATPYSQFASPLSDKNVCGKTFVIFIGNPNQSGPASDSPANGAALSALNNNRDAKGNLIPVSQIALPNFTTQSTISSTTVGTTAQCYKSATAAEAELASDPFSASCSAYSDGCTIGAAVADASCSGNNSKYKVLGTDTTYTTTPTGTTSTDTGPRNADEWARFLHDAGVPVANSTIRPSVVTYTIDVYNAQPDATQTALLLSMAKAGGGKYFAARNEQAIIDALRQIMVEIQAVNTTFASTALPVSDNRTTNQNEVFIGMFRPDPVAKPRWFGNLKRYQMIRSGSDIALGDANGQAAVNPLTGFVTPCATSFWTTDSGSYWSGMGLNPDPAGTCTTTSFNKYSDAPDGPFVEKGAAAEVLRRGNVANGTTLALNRKVLTVANGAVADFTAANTGLADSLVKFISGQDVNNEKGNGDTTTTRPSIHGDVIHSRPLPVNYGTDNGGVTVYYGANDGTLHAIRADNGVERWALVAPEFFPRLSRLKDNSPVVAYPDIKDGFTPAPTPKDYFFDGSIGLYQNLNNSKVWIYPSMRRGGRMVYALDVTDPAAPSLLWKAGCPNVDVANSTGCTNGMSNIGQTWSTPSVAFIKGYSTTRPVVAFGGGYDPCEDKDMVQPGTGGCTSGKEYGGNVYILDAQDGTLLASFATDRAVAADVAFVDADGDGKPDYLYAVDTGGNIYRVDFVSSPTQPLETLGQNKWTIHKVAYTKGGGRKFLFAPAVLYSQQKVYLALGSGDREHPLPGQYPFANVVNRFYVYKDDLARTPASDAQAIDLDSMTDVSSTDSCVAPKVLPSGDLNGWFIKLNQYGQGEQTVSSALIAGGMITFNTSRPIAPAEGTCTTALGEARGYWLNLVNGSGAIGVQGICGGRRSSRFAGGGLPPSPVLANSVQVDGKSVTVTIGAVPKDSDMGNDGGGYGNGPGASPINPALFKVQILSKRVRKYRYTTGGGD